MTNLDQVFRIAVRQFGPFESSIAKQWDDFERRNDTSLRLEVIPLDLHSLYESLFINRGLSLSHWDAAFVSTDWLAEAAESNVLMDLKPYLDVRPPDGYPDAWSESLLRLQCFDDRIVGLPYHDGPECLIYRNDLFESRLERDRFFQRYGEPLQVPKTWEQFRRVAQYFTRPEQSLYGTVFAAFPDTHNTVYDFCLQLWTRGGELFNDDGHLRLDTPEANAALEFYRCLLKDKSAVHPESRAYDSVKSGQAFAAGEVAMMVNWFGFASMSETIAESRVKGSVAVAAIPSGGGPRTSLNAYWVLSIPSRSRHCEVGWEFLRHCASKEMDKLLTLEGGIGCRKSTWSDAEVNAQIPFYYSLEKLHQEARELPRRSDWSQIAAEIDQVVRQALDSEESTATILQAAQQRTNRTYQRRKKNA